MGQEVNFNTTREDGALISQIVDRAEAFNLLAGKGRLDRMSVPVPVMPCQTCGGTIWRQDKWFQCPDCGEKSTEWGGHFPALLFCGEKVGPAPEFKAAVDAVRYPQLKEDKTMPKEHKNYSYDFKELSDATRAEAFNLLAGKGRLDRMSASMDLTACHLNGCPLKLQALLDSEPGDFRHDVFGIFKHIDRATGELTRCFLPRYADKKRSFESVETVDM